MKLSLKKIVVMSLASCLTLVGCSSNSETPSTIEKSHRDISKSESEVSQQPEDDTKSTNDSGGSRQENQNETKLSGDLEKDSDILVELSQTIISSPMATWTFQNPEISDLGVEFDSSIDSFKSLTDDNIVYAFVVKGQPMRVIDGNILRVEYDGLLAQSPYIGTNNPNQVARDMQSHFDKIDGGERALGRVIFTYKFVDNKLQASLEARK